MDKPININNRLFREREIKIGNRGYDVIRNCFFVEEVSEGRSPSYKKFPIFAEYFDYLNGDIYSSANYYKYNFSLEELNQFDIDLTLQKKPFAPGRREGEKRLFQPYHKKRSI